MPTPGRDHSCAGPHVSVSWWCWAGVGVPGAAVARFWTGGGGRGAEVLVVWWAAASTRVLGFMACVCWARLGSGAPLVSSGEGHDASLVLGTAGFASGVCQVRSGGGVSFVSSAKVFEAAGRLLFVAEGPVAGRCCPGAAPWVASCLPGVLASGAGGGSSGWRLGEAVGVRHAHGDVEAAVSRVLQTAVEAAACSSRLPGGSDVRLVDRSWESSPVVFQVPAGSGQVVAGLGRVGGSCGRSSSGGEGRGLGALAGRESSAIGGWRTAGRLASVAIWSN
ncbi:hypothetical protein ACRB68_35520 [Actinomadura sp. RB68]|uniref:Uncharacterized protein n=1 Tax=Actinomadura macrotermitis TaxID=2585200 RepID=A0A7K0BWM5_9ACTN|nr:hypothetical protein [Actinomadura macrotermitis]